MRLHLFLLLPVVVLGLLGFSTCTSFFGKTSMGLAQSLILLEMIPASLSCLFSCSTNSLYLNGTVYGLDATGRPTMGMSNSIRLVLLMSTAHLETILLYLMSRSCWKYFPGYLMYNSIWNGFYNIISIGL